MVGADYNFLNGVVVYLFFTFYGLVNNLSANCEALFN